MNTELVDCKFFLTSQCKKGAQCRYRHCNAAKLTDRNDVCPNWLNGTCQERLCPSRHPQFDFICKHILHKGFCHQGSNCSFTHPSPEVIRSTRNFEYLKTMLPHESHSNNSSPHNYPQSGPNTNSSLFLPRSVKSSPQTMTVQSPSFLPSQKNTLLMPIHRSLTQQKHLQTQNQTQTQTQHQQITNGHLRLIQNHENEAPSLKFPQSFDVFSTTSLNNEQKKPKTALRSSLNDFHPFIHSSNSTPSSSFFSSENISHSQFDTLNFQPNFNETQTTFPSSIPHSPNAKLSEPPFSLYISTFPQTDTDPILNYSNVFPSNTDTYDVMTSKANASPSFSSHSFLPFQQQTDFHSAPSTPKHMLSPLLSVGLNNPYPQDGPFSLQNQNQTISRQNQSGKGFPNGTELSLNNAIQSTSFNQRHDYRQLPITLRHSYNVTSSAPQELPFNYSISEDPNSISFEQTITNLVI